jgi:hypothetical protein
LTALARFVATMLGRGAVRRRSARPAIHARYDAAQTYPGNRDHWGGADGLSPLAANTPAVRRKLRERARYERDNDPHLNGLTKTLAYDLVGTGPRLQLTLGEENFAAAQVVERAFAAWSRATNFADKLRLMQEARPTDGEGVRSCSLRTPESATRSSSTSSAARVRTDRHADFNAGFAVPIEQGYWDGIEFDPAGSPDRLPRPPAAPRRLVVAHRPDRRVSTCVPARNMVHWFRPTRAGQTRGVCELAAEPADRERRPGGTRRPS